MMHVWIWVLWLVGVCSGSEYWWVYYNTDCNGNDVKHVAEEDPTVLKKVCAATDGCVGFNTHGWLKAKACGDHKGTQPGVDLYLMEGTPQPPPPGSPPIWPLPQMINTTAGSLSLDSGFTITTTSHSTRLKRGIARYTAIIRNETKTAVTMGGAIRTISVLTTSDSEELSRGTSYKYTLSISSSGDCRVTADTPYGALYGLESFSQLVVGGHVNYSSVEITDWPHYFHRAQHYDTGRRFWPVNTVKAVIDGMSYNKMNVLHMHLNDDCRFSVESHKYPELTAGLTGIMAGHYTQDDVRELVSYAGDRGIRVIPEFDVPGHCHGLGNFSGPTGLQFCSSTHNELYGDANNVTLNIIKDLWREMSALWPDHEFHIGADETSATGSCTFQDIVAFEMLLVAFVQNELNKTVGGWEEYAFETKVAPKVNSVVNTWHYHTQAEATALGYHTVASNDSHFYLLYQQPATKYWVDIASGQTSQQRAFLMGGVVSAWTDNYCWESYCKHPGKYPVAHNLFAPSSDPVFHESILNVMWPRAAVAGGSFWNWQSSLDASTGVFREVVSGIVSRLHQRGVPACPAECGVCTSCERCGKKYEGC